VSRLGTVGRGAGVLGAALGVIAAGAAVGLAAERYAVGRSFKRDAMQGDWSDEPLGGLHGEPVKVIADDGVALHVEVDEPPGAPQATIVFTHGYALNHDSWHYQRRDLGDLGRLVFWDLRGHGRSERGDTDHATFSQLGRDLHRVLEEVVPEGPVVLVGHSMGGMAIMALAEQHPKLFGDRVIGVALISTSPGRLAEVTLGVPAYLGRHLRRAAPRLVAALSNRAELVDKGRQMGTDLGYVLTKRLSFDSEVPPVLVEFVAEMISATPFDVLAELFPAFDAHNAIEALDVLNGVETLVLVGSGDLLTPADHSRDMVGRVPGAELVVIEPGGHMVILERYALVNSHLRALGERALRAASR
jgi:pimeloyl-ACP methyl ester carboxylesterase